MIFDVVQLLFTWVAAMKLAQDITPHTKHLTEEERLSYAYFMVDSGKRHKVDPYFIAAVAWHESRFNNLPRNTTNDYGVMQVHWQQLSVDEKWLDGLKPRDLLDPQTNIEAGTKELVHLRSFCARLGHTDHHWWGHLKWGVVVMSRAYDQTILWRYRLLKTGSPLPPRPPRPPRSTS